MDYVLGLNYFSGHLSGKSICESLSHKLRPLINVKRITRPAVSLALNTNTTNTYLVY